MLEIPKRANFRCSHYILDNWLDQEVDVLIGLSAVIISLCKCILNYHVQFKNIQFLFKNKTIRYSPQKREHFFSAFGAQTWSGEEFYGQLVIRTLVFLFTMQTTAECMALILVSRIWSQSHFPCDRETAFIHFSKYNIILLNSFVSNNIVSCGITATSENTSNWLPIAGKLARIKISLSIYLLQHVHIRKKLTSSIHRPRSLDCKASSPEVWLWKQSQSTRCKSYHSAHTEYATTSLPRSSKLLVQSGEKANIVHS